MKNVYEMYVNDCAKRKYDYQLLNESISCLRGESTMKQMSVGKLESD